MRSAMILAVMAILSPLYGGDLDKIDANGVTETGGSTNYARMLTRTGVDGRLSASLLPPVADWASQPIPRMYYVAANASVQGNGSPQYPFTNLTYAVANMADKSVLVLAPGSYSGTITITAGKSVTLFGMGGQTQVSRLDVTAVGTSSATLLDLCGLHIGTLSVQGGRINLRLAGTTVSQLAGSASPVTVTRTDMASRIDVSTLTHVDVYSGHTIFAPEAGMLTDSTGTRHLLLVGGRGAVTYGASTNSLAYVADVTSATAAVYVAIGSLASTNTVLSGRIAAESDARSAADVTLSNRIEQVRTALLEDYGSLGTAWNSQIGLLVGRIDTTDSAVSSLVAKENGDIARVTSSVAQTSNAFVTADSRLRADLISISSNDVSRMRETVIGIARTNAEDIVDTKIGAATNGVIANAVAQANSAAITREAVLSNTIAGVDSKFIYWQSIVTNNALQLSTLSGTVSGVQGDVSSLNTRLNNMTTTVNTMQTGVNSLSSSVDLLDSSVSSNATAISQIKSRINSIIDYLASVTNVTHNTNLPPKF